MSILFAASMLLATTAQENDDQTRGIGQYPSNLNEYFAPTVGWPDGRKRDPGIALQEILVLSK